MLEAQRAAFFADLPVPLSMRRARLNKLAALIEQNADAVGAALVADGVADDAESAKSAEVELALATLRSTMNGLDQWVRPQRRPGLRALLGEGSDYVEYQPIGVIGIAAPPSLLQTTRVLAGALAAGNRAVLTFDDASPELGQRFARLVPDFFDPLELAVVPVHIFADAAFDLRVAKSDGPVMYSEKSPVILGRSADFAAASANVIAQKRLAGGRAPLAPDYVLVPGEEEEVLAGWLWRAAMRAGADGSTLTEGQQEELTRLLDDARARGGEIMRAEPQGAGTPLHIVRHASDDMLVMQGDFRGPILPLRNYARIENAVAAIQQQHAAPPAIYYFGRDTAERNYVLEHTLSAEISIEGQSLSTTRADTKVTADIDRDEANFRRFSRARRVSLPSSFGFLRWPSRERGDDLGGAALAPN